MSREDGVSTVALFVSLIALLIALGQLLQQIFGTAEGYRSCNASVMGPWAKTRHRTFHLRELRLETLFQTPEFALVETASDGVEPAMDDPLIASSGDSARSVKTRKSLVYTIDGSQKSLESTYTCEKIGAPSKSISEKMLPLFEPVLEKVETFFSKGENSNPARGNPMSMAVGWLTFLQKLHEHEKKYEGLTSMPLLFKEQTLSNIRRSRPAVRRVQRSWDFIPADALRPLASAQFGDLLTLCYRMCIRWYDLQLGQRTLRAEGWGHSFTLINVRGLGFVFEYRFGGSNLSVPRDDGSDHPANKHFIPSKHADMLAFGLIPADDKLISGYEHFDLGGDDYFTSIIEMHEAIGVGPAMLEDFRSHQGNPTDEYFHVSNEALYMLAPFIPLHSVGAVKIQPPFKHRFGSMCTFREGRLVLYERLRRHIQSKAKPVSDQLQHVHDVFYHLATHSNTKEEFQHWQGFKYRTFAKNAKSPESRVILEDLHTEFDKTTKFL